MTIGLRGSVLSRSLLVAAYLLLGLSAAFAQAQDEPKKTVFLNETPDQVLIIYEAPIANAKSDTVKGYVWFETVNDKGDTIHRIINATVTLVEDPVPLIPTELAASTPALKPAVRSVVLSDFTDDGKPFALVADIKTGKRPYRIELKGLKFFSPNPKADIKPQEVQAAVAVEALQGRPARLALPAPNPDQRDTLMLGTIGIEQALFATRLAKAPGELEIHFEFAPTDPQPNYKLRASRVTAIESVGSGDPGLLVTLPEPLPRRPKYKISVSVSKTMVPLQPGYTLPKEPELRASVPVDFPPPSVDRLGSQYYFETNFTSTVNSETGDRTNVGLFGIALKPQLGFDVIGKTGWQAFRPLVTADFDTLNRRVSKGPSRIVFGLDYELGKIWADPKRPLQQLVWVNGIRHESDRDFKRQSLLWRTELVPFFFNFEQTQEQRLYNFLLSASFDPDRMKQPTVTAYRFRPSFGYELGGVVRQPSGLPEAERVSRFFVTIDASVELVRAVTLGAQGTYYYVDTLERRPNRAYLEARIDLNTGTLFNVDLGRFQSALGFKYQRGEQPPTFAPVNVFSVGFKIYK